jgi:copper chaperone
MKEYKSIPDLGVSRENEQVVLYVENIKCGGCANTITKAMKEINLENIDVDFETNQVKFKDPKQDAPILQALSKLRNLGYPLVDSEEGLTRLALKAKSFTSCAIGKINS